MRSFPSPLSLALSWGSELRTQIWPGGCAARAAAFISGEEGRRGVMAGTLSVRAPQLASSARPALRKSRRWQGERRVTASAWPWGGPVGVRDGNFCWGPRRLGHPRNAAMLLSSVSSGGDVVLLGGFAVALSSDQLMVLHKAKPCRWVFLD